jgi:hypothetical protein
MPESRFWGIRLGEGGEFARICRTQRYAAIGWNELGDLRWLLPADDASGWEKLFGLFHRVSKKMRWGHEQAKDLTRDVNQVFNFVKSIGENDFVLSPTPARTYLVGTRCGEYHYARKKDRCRYRHRRTVEWVNEISRDALSDRLKRTLNAHLTVFRIEGHDDELRAIVEGRPLPKPSGVTYPTREDEESVVGKAINFRGLVYSPVNHEGVVFLFAKVSKDLNIEIEEIRTRFPDAIARVQTTKGFAKRTIEFEYRSSNYQEHLPKVCDIIVCWQNDWGDRCPSAIQVIELRRVVEELRKKDALSSSPV